MSHRGVASLLVTLGAAWLLACEGARQGRDVPIGGDRTELPAVPAMPEPERLDPGVRQQLADRREVLDRVLAREDADDEHRARAYGELAKLYHAYGWLDGARDLYQLAHHYRAEDPQWPHLLGLVERALGRPEAAEAALRAALVLSPADPALHVYLGEIGLESGRDTDAEQQFRAALQLDPECRRARLGLGRVELRQGNAAAAIEELELARGGRGGAALADTESEILYPLAMAHRQTGNGEAATQLLAQMQTSHLTRRPVVLVDPVLHEVQSLRQDAVHLEQRALKAIAQGSLQEAETLLRRAVTVQPSYLDARHNLAQVLARQGRLQRAEAEMRQALIQDPTFLPSRLSLARLLEMQGRPGEARAELHQALIHHPSSEAAREQLQRLQAVGDDS